MIKDKRMSWQKSTQLQTSTGWLMREARLVSDGLDKEQGAKSKGNPQWVQALLANRQTGSGEYLMGPGASCMVVSHSLEGKEDEEEANRSSGEAGRRASVYSACKETVIRSGGEGNRIWVRGQPEPHRETSETNKPETTFEKTVTGDGHTLPVPKT